LGTLTLFRSSLDPTADTAAVKDVAVFLAIDANRRSGA
jgi:hypothetical protein